MADGLKLTPPQPTPPPPPARKPHPGGADAAQHRPLPFSARLTPVPPPANANAGRPPAAPAARLAAAPAAVTAPHPSFQPAAPQRLVNLLQEARGRVQIAAVRRNAAPRPAQTPATGATAAPARLEELAARTPTQVTGQPSFRVEARNPEIQFAATRRTATTTPPPGPGPALQAAIPAARGEAPQPVNPAFAPTPLQAAVRQASAQQALVAAATSRSAQASVGTAGVPRHPRPIFDQTI